MVRGNWGRWGSDDEAGAANLMTPESVLAALRLAVRGRVYPLAQPISAMSPRSDSGLSLHLMAQDGADYASGAIQPQSGGEAVAMDYLLLRLHGSATHVDALGHVWAGGELYNGHPSASTGSRGLARCGIENLGSLVARGVLLDVAGHLQVPHLSAGHEITASELAACSSEQGIEPEAGDVVLIRTGYSRVYAADPESWTWEFPGLGLEAARWLAERDVVLVGADNLGVEVRTRADPWTLPVHLCLLREHGIYMLELLDLERLAEDRVHKFVFVMAPLPIVGGSGSPVNPLAIA